MSNLKYPNIAAAIPIYESKYAQLSRWFDNGVKGDEPPDGFKTFDDFVIEYERRLDEIRRELATAYYEDTKNVNSLEKCLELVDIHNAKNLNKHNLPEQL